MKKIIIGLVATVLIAGGVLYAKSQTAKADCCAKDSACCHPGSSCCVKK